MRPNFVYFLSLVIFAKNINARVRITPINSQNRTIVDGREQPLVKFATLYADRSGATHVNTCKFEGLSFESYALPAEPQWVGLLSDVVESMVVAVLPVNYTSTWHSAPGPQWVITLSGAWSLEATDGHILTQNAGDLHFDQDTNSKPRPKDPRVGHVTRTVGDAPCVQLILKLKNHPNYVCV